MDRKREFSEDCLRSLRKAGFEAYFAGGCVRDLILGRQPNDYDIATNALPKDVKSLFSKVIPVGEAFNVSLVVSEDLEPIHVEIAMFRKDIGIKDGRHPEKVEAATAEEDVQRRDFTINGMLYDPIENKILDYVGGQRDLKEGIIRAIGSPSERIKEDYLRMLRAIRFSARFNYPIEPELWKSIQDFASEIKRISAERIFEEYSKMLTEGNAHIAFELLADSSLLEFIIPELLPMKSCEQPPEYHPEGDVWIHTMLLLKQLTVEHSKELAWGCLLHDIGKPPTFSHEPPDRIRFNRHAQVGEEMSEVILRRLKAPNKLIEIVCELVRDHLKFADVKNMRPATLKRFLRNPIFSLHLEQHRIDCLASHENLELYDFCKEQLNRLSEEDLRPSALIDGNDLIQLGFKPGPKFKDILEYIENLQLEGQLVNKAQAIEALKKAFPL